jgi:amidohydrolase
MDLKQRARDAFEAVEGELRSISRWMYDNPEIAYEEREASRRLVEFLTAHGFDVEYPAYGLETAFAARVGSSGPEVIVCAEYDALPGVGHACGHNIIATSSVGAGAALSSLADELGCRITVLGTPAEEKFGGKVDLIRAGAFEGATASMMVHPAPDFEEVVDPTALAIAHLSVEYRGKDAHASASPWEGRNALDAFVQLYMNVSTFRQQMRPTDKMHGIVTHGGDAPNIIPSLTRSEWYVRAATKERLDHLARRFRDMAEAAASSTACEVSITPQGHEYEDLIHEPTMIDLYLANSEALGRPMRRETPEDALNAGSTDMGNVSHVVASIHPYVGMATGGAVNHQPEFAAHTITEDGDRALRDSALAMAWTIIDLAEGDLWDQLVQPGT